MCCMALLIRVYQFLFPLKLNLKLLVSLVPLLGFATWRAIVLGSLERLVGSLIHVGEVD